MKRVAALAVVLMFAGCKKPPTPETPGEPEQPSTGEELPQPPVPQEPDPPALAEAGDAYLGGHYEQAQQILEPLYEDLKQREQWRASALAAGWLALVHADRVFENAEAPARHAQEMAEKTADVEVDAMAALAAGAYALGAQDYAAAVDSFGKAALLGKGTRLGVVAQIKYAETLINRAFGAEGEALENPEDLDRARKAYDEALAASEKLDKNAILLGRIEEGRAALADYRKDKREVCAYAVAAYGHLEQAKASEELLSVADKLIANYKCQRPTTQKPATPASEGNGS